jgi:glucokinase
MSRGYLVVGGDIGGTNSRLKLYEVKEKDIGLTEGLR